MARKFVIRLRKGGPAGIIVANSQVIDIAPLSSDVMRPNNFTDGRLQGKITTLNRVASFIKTVSPAATTTTTSTTTTTTRAPNAKPRFTPTLEPSVVNVNTKFTWLLNGGPTAGVNNTEPVSVTIRKKSDVTDFFGNGYVAGTWISTTGTPNQSSTFILSASGSLSQPDQLYPLAGTVTYEVTFPSSILWEVSSNPITFIQVAKPAADTATIITISVSSLTVTEGGTLQVTVSHPNATVGSIYWLGILQVKNSPAIANDNIYRPDLNSVTPVATATNPNPTRFISAGPNSIATKIVVGTIPGTTIPSPTTTVDIKFADTLSWLAGDFKGWNFVVFPNISTNNRPNDTQALATYTSDPAKLPTLKRRTVGKPTLKIDDTALSVRDYIVYINQGNTGRIILGDLTVGTRYALQVLHNRTADLPVIIKDSWFDFNFLTGSYSDSYEGWIKGESLGKGTFPNGKGIYNYRGSTVHTWYYVFTATSSTKTINIPIKSSAQINAIYNDQNGILNGWELVNPDLIFTFNLTNSNGTQTIDVNTLNKYLHYNIRDITTLITVQYFTKDDKDRGVLQKNYTLKEGTTNYFTVSVISDRILTATDLGSSGRRFLVNFPGLTSQDISATDNLSQPLLPKTTGASINGFTGVTYQFDFTSSNSSETIANQQVRITALKDNVNDTKTTGVRVYSYFVEEENSNNRIMITHANYPDVLKIEESAESLSSVVSPPVVTEWKTNASVDASTGKNFITEGMELKGFFKITDTVSRTIYWRALGLTDEDFSGPATGTFLSKNGVETVNWSVRLAQNADGFARDLNNRDFEEFAVVFYLTQENFQKQTQAFYVSPSIVVLNKNSYEPKVRIAETSGPPFYQNSTLIFLFSDGEPLDKVDVYDADSNWKLPDTIVLDANGAATYTSPPFTDVRSYNFKVQFRSSGNELRLGFIIVPSPKSGPETPTTSVGGGGQSGGGQSGGGQSGGGRDSGLGTFVQLQ